MNKNILIALFLVFMLPQMAFKPISDLLNPEDAKRLVINSLERKSKVKNTNIVNLKDDPIFFKISKSELLQLINPFKEDDQKNLVIKFGCKGKEDKYAELDLYLTVMNKKGDEFGEVLVPTPLTFRTFSKAQKIKSYNQATNNFLERSKIIEFEDSNFIKLISYEKPKINTEKGGIAHYIKLPNGVKGVSIKDWLDNYFTATQDDVYIYPAYDTVNQYTTVVFSKSSDLMDVFIAPQESTKGNYFDKGGCCCPPQ